MKLFDFFKRKKAPEPVIVINPPYQAKAKHQLHSTGDVHDFLKEKFGATLDIVTTGTGSKIVRLHKLDGSVSVGHGETVDTATGALIDSLGGL